RLPGVLKVVRDGSFLAVIADGEWRAIKAAGALGGAAPRAGGGWAPGGPFAPPLGPPGAAAPVARPGPPPAPRRAPPPAAEYRRAFQMHGAIGPSCALAELSGGRLTVFTHSQTVFDTLPAIAKLVGLRPEQVRLRHVQGSGCYGHNAADDAAADAALLACA